MDKNTITGLVPVSYTHLPAVIKAIGVPCIPFGTLTRLMCSRRPANSVSAKPKPSAVENA